MTRKSSTAAIDGQTMAEAMANPRQMPEGMQGESFCTVEAKHLTVKEKQAVIERWKQLPDGFEAMGRHAQG